MNRASFKIRAVLLALVILLIVGLYGVRLMSMQVVDGSSYAQLAKKRNSLTQTILAARGELVDRYGRPLVINESCFDIVFDKTSMIRGQENQIILKMFQLFEESGESWIDNLPLTKEQPFSFEEGASEAVSRLKKFLELQEYASASDVMLSLIERYDLEEYDPQTQRKLAGVRYEMEQRGYSINVPYTFASNVSKELVTKVSERSDELPGVRESESTTRNYVAGDLAASLIGIIGPIYQEEYQEYKEKGYLLNDTIGKFGVEKAYESTLRGTNGQRRIELVDGMVEEVIDEVEPQPGNTIALTIDKNLQAVAQKALENRVKNLNETAEPLKGKEAEGAAAVVINVKTGEILVAANYPSYDLSTYNQDYAALSQDPLHPLMNRAFNGAYTPGSVFKPGMAVAGLAEGVIEDAYDTVECKKVYTYFQDYQPECTQYHGKINVMDAIKQSCNIFFYDVGRRLGIETINRYGTMFGFGQSVGVELSSAKGQLSSPELSASLGETWEAGDVLQTSIGQSKTMATPLQLASYAATIANKGVRMQPYLIKSVHSYSFDTVISETMPEVVCDMQVDGEVFDIVGEGMERMASYWFADYPVRVATKTGTPQFYGDYTNSTFISYAPADDPEIAVAVVVEKGGGVPCAPIVKEIYDAYFGFGDGSNQQSDGNLLLQ